MNRFTRTVRGSLQNPNLLLLIQQALRANCSPHRPSRSVCLSGRQHEYLIKLGEGAESRQETSGKRRADKQIPLGVIKTTNRFHRNYRQLRLT